MPLNRKKAEIIEHIERKGPLIISFSGGVDSSLLAAFAKRGKKRSFCIFLDSDLVSEKNKKLAGIRAKELGIEYKVVKFPILDDPDFRKNPKNRCYICKKLASNILKDIARQRNCMNVADGVNTTDLSEFRPGLAACKEEGILHPFVECGISKNDIRTIAAECGYSFGLAPSDTCLATRIPYGDEITPELLRKIEQAEEVIAALGCSVVRVRAYGEMAGIEVLPEDFPGIINNREVITACFREIGFRLATLDLEGYRSGSMDKTG